MSERPRILVVDDEPRSLELLVRTLRRLGRVDTASTGEQAWAHARTAPLDLVISDQRMPGMKGVDLLARVAQLDAPIGRILLTGYADMSATIDAINESRIHAYVSKPWAPDQLVQTVQGLLARIALERQNQELLATLRDKNEELEEILSSLRAAQRKMVESERLAAIGRLGAMIVHDFRGPLSVLRSATGELARATDALPDDELRAIAASAQEETERMLRMCAELQDLNRVSAAHGERATEELDDWVASVAVVVAQEAGRAGVALETELGCSAWVAIDADRMRRALLNLVYNAIEAMPDGGHLRVATERAGDEAVLVVADTGPGIPEAIRETLFEPFVTAGKAKGSGLGLAVVKKVVDDHGGSIAVDKGDAGGTAFTIRLPLASAPEA